MYMYRHIYMYPNLIHLSVYLSGIGLSKDARDDLFQPFKQAQRLAGGT
jgi:signal transduction histidine kinase